MSAQIDEMTGQAEQLAQTAAALKELVGQFRSTTTSEDAAVPAVAGPRVATGPSVRSTRRRAA